MAPEALTASDTNVQRGPVTDPLADTTLGTVMEAKTRGLQTIVDGLAKRIGRNVAIDDPQIHLLAYSPQIGVTDVQRVQSIMQMKVDEAIVKHVYRQGVASSELPLVVRGIPGIGMLDRLCVPVRCQSLLFGFLWVIDGDHTLSEESIASCREAADAAGEVLMRERFPNDERRQLEGRVALGLLDKEISVRARAYDQGLEDELFGAAEACCVVLMRCGEMGTAASQESGTQLEHLLRSIGQRIAPLSALAAVMDPARGVLVVHGNAQTIERLVGSSAASLFEEAKAAHAGVNGLGVAVGSVEHSVAGARLSYTAAVSALLVGDHVDGFGPITAWSELGVYQLLCQFPGIETGDARLPEPVRELLADRNGEQMADTLEAYLDLGGSTQETAARFHLHRTTLYYRLGRIEELTGQSLANGQDRLLLHLGLKLARLQGYRTARRTHAEPSR